MSEYLAAHPSTVTMRRFLLGCLSAVTLAIPAAAQRKRAADDAPTRAAIDEFTVTVRDMAAWAIVTPAAHIPVGGMLDTAGNVESVVGSEKGGADTPDSVLVAFRRALGNAARQRRLRAIGLGYLVHVTPPGRTTAVDAVMVEIEFRTGHRANVLYPYTREESGEAVFADPIRAAGTLRVIAGSPRGRRAEQEPVAAPPPPSAASSASSTAADTARPSLEEHARRIVRAVPYPTFITTDATGRPQARTVQPSAPDSAWTVWFATNPRTRKVTEVRRDARVVLHYFDQGTLSYVSLIGRARVVRDAATKSAHWDPAWTAFYPDRDTSVVLIAVDAERLEVVSSTLGISGDAATWRPSTVGIPRRKPAPR